MLAPVASALPVQLISAIRENIDEPTEDADVESWSEIDELVRLARERAHGLVTAA